MTMSRIALLSANLLKGLWDKASEWAAHTKNRIPHKSLPRPPIEIMLGKDAREERKNLRPLDPLAKKSLVMTTRSLTSYPHRAMKLE